VGHVVTEPAKMGTDEKVAVQRGKRTQPAAVQKGPQPPNTRVIAAILDDRQQPARPVRGLDHLPRVLQRVGQWLLAEDVAAAPKRGHRHRIVRLGHRAVEDGCGCGTVQDLAQFGANDRRLAPELCGARPRCLLDNVHEPDHLHVGHTGDGPQPGGGDPAAAYQDGPYLAGHDAAPFPAAAPVPIVILSPALPTAPHPRTATAGRLTPGRGPDILR